MKKNQPQIRKIKAADIPYAACDQPGCFNGAAWVVRENNIEHAYCYTHVQMHGYWIDGNDQAHQIIDHSKNHCAVAADPSTDENGYYTGYCQCNCPQCQEGRKHCQGLICRGD